MDMTCCCCRQAVLQNSNLSLGKKNEMETWKRNIANEISSATGADHLSNIAWITMRRHVYTEARADHLSGPAAINTHDSSSSVTTGRPYIMGRTGAFVRTPSVSPRAYRKGGTSHSLFASASGSPSTPRRRRAAAAAARSSSKPRGALVAERVARALRERALTISDAFHRCAGAGETFVHRLQLFSGLAQLGIAVSEAECNALFTHLDTNCDMRIEWSEWIEITAAAADPSAAAPGAPPSPSLWRREPGVQPAWEPFDSTMLTLAEYSTTRDLENRLFHDVAASSSTRRHGRRRGRGTHAGASLSGPRTPERSSSSSSSNNTFDASSPISPSRAPPPPPPVDKERHFVAAAARALLIARTERAELSVEHDAAKRDAAAAAADEKAASQRVAAQRAQLDAQLQGCTRVMAERAEAKRALALALSEHRTLDRRLVDETSAGQISTTASGEEPSILCDLRVALEASAHALTVKMKLVHTAKAGQSEAVDAVQALRIALEAKSALRAQLAAQVRATEEWEHAAQREQEHALV